MDDSCNYNLDLISVANEARELIPTLENTTEVDTSDAEEVDTSDAEDFEELD